MSVGTLRGLALDSSDLPIASEHLSFLVLAKAVDLGGEVKCQRTATMGKVVAIVLATSLSDSFFLDGSLYGITENMHMSRNDLLKTLEVLIPKSALRISFLLEEVGAIFQGLPIRECIYERIHSTV